MMRVAVTGPSETLSYHPSLSAKDARAELNGDFDNPGPPTTTSRPFASVRSVARLMSLTTFPLDFPFANSIEPVSGEPAESDPSIEPSAEMTSFSRLKPLLRRPGCGFRPSVSRIFAAAALRFESRTVHLILIDVVGTISAITVSFSLLSMSRR